MNNPATNYHQRITKDPAILSGKPVVRDTRIAVELVLASLAQNPRLEDLFADYPELTMEDIQACLAYAQATIARQKGTRRKRAPTQADREAFLASAGSWAGNVDGEQLKRDIAQSRGIVSDPGEVVTTMERDEARKRLFAPVSEEEIARRQALLKEILKNRERRNIAPLTTADLVREVREEEYRSYDDRR